MDANDSLKYNLLVNQSKKELQSCKQIMELLTEGYSYLNNIVGTLFAWSKAGTATAFDQAVWAEQLKALAPVFQIKETLTISQAKVPSINITIPEEIKQHQYSLALYNDTTLLINKMRKIFFLVQNS